MKFVSWNVNGLRAVISKGFEQIFNGFDADFFCVQEIKLQEGQIDLNLEGYDSFYNYAERKGYSGTAVFSRHKPLSVRRGIGVERHDTEGRVLTLEYDGFYLVNVYVPNSQRELTRLDYRMDWEAEFLKYITQLDSEKPVIICGDMNCAHEEIDLANPKTNRRNAGFTDEERHIPVSPSRRKRSIQLVEFPRWCQSQECRLAYRLLHHLEKTCRQSRRRFDSSRHHGCGPLSGKHHNRMI